MARKTNCVINGKEYYRIYRKVGMKVNSKGVWVDDRRAFYSSCKRDAEEKYQEYMNRKRAGTANINKVLGELADQHIYSVFIHDPACADSTKKQYINSYKNHVQSSHIAGMLPHEISSMDIQELYNDMNCAPAGLTNTHNMMRLIFRYLEREQICRDLTANLVLPKKQPSTAAQKTSSGENGEIVVRSNKEMRLILDGLEGHRLRLLVIMAYNTGCRLSELLALSYDDISGNFLTVNKQLSKKYEFSPLETTSNLQVSRRQKTVTAARTIPLNETVLNALEVHKKWQRIEMMEKGYRTEFLFTTSTGHFYDRRCVSRALSRLYQRIGVPDKAFHVYRHTFGTNLCKKGVQIQTASKLLGHTDINMTAKYYINVDMAEKESTVNLL